MGFPRPALIPHFLFTTCRTVTVFYFSIKGYLIQSVTWQIYHIFVNDVPEDMKVADFVACIDGEAASLIQRTSAFTGECIGKVSNQIYGLPMSDPMVLTMIHGTSLFIVGAFVIIMLIELIRSGAETPGGGKYIAFTFRVQKTLPYKIMSGILVGFVFCIMLDTIRMTVMIYLKHGEKLAKAYGLSNVPTIGGLVYAAISLLQQHKDPMFDPETDAFKALQFNRTAQDCLVHNTDFVKNLESALLEAKYGQPKELEAFLTKKYSWQKQASTAEEVLKACTPKDAPKTGAEAALLKP